MRVHRVAISIIFAVNLGFGQRHKPIIDPETKEGYVIQLIQQERDPVEKVKLMNGFVGEFPKSASLSWVYDQLQPVYQKASDWDRVIGLGEKMLELDADDLYAAHSSLEAAEVLKNPELIQKYAITCWRIASKLSINPKYSQPEYARQVVAYSEYSIAALVIDEKDSAKKKAYQKSLEALNPKSLWLNTSKGDFSNLAQGLGKEKLVTLAVKMLSGDPHNEDMLMVVADYHMQRGDAPDMVLEFSSRVLEILRTKNRPDGISPDDWERKKENYLGAAHYMVGVVSSMKGLYTVADKNLRAALPTVKASNSQVLGATLYHLGYANYQLAEKGERPRIFDAIRFNEQCATIPSSFREQAVKNVESIKSEYNLR